jgi:hypothetical protein
LARIALDYGDKTGRFAGGSTLETIALPPQHAAQGMSRFTGSTVLFLMNEMQWIHSQQL